MIVSHLYSVFSAGIIPENTRASECRRKYHLEIWNNSMKIQFLLICGVGSPSESIENVLLEDYWYHSLHPSEVVTEDNLLTAPPVEYSSILVLLPGNKDKV